MNKTKTEATLYHVWAINETGRRDRLTETPDTLAACRTIVSKQSYPLAPGVRIAIQPARSGDTLTSRDDAPLPTEEPSDIAIKAPIANASDMDWCDNLYRLNFGAYGSVVVYAWASSFDAAFEHAVEYCDSQGLIGIFTFLTVADYVEAAFDLGVVWNASEPDVRVIEHAEADLTSIGWTTLECESAERGSAFVASWEWGGSEVCGVDLECVGARSRAEILADCDDSREEAFCNSVEICDVEGTVIVLASGPVAVDSDFCAENDTVIATLHSIPDVLVTSLGSCRGIQFSSITERAAFFASRL